MTIRGRQIGSFALQRRVLASYDDFPKVLRDAIISTEDKTFETHWGINFWRVMGATYRDITSKLARAGRFHADHAAFAQSVPFAGAPFQPQDTGSDPGHAD